MATEWVQTVLRPERPLGITVVREGEEWVASSSYRGGMEVRGDSREEAVSRLREGALAVLEAHLDEWERQPAWAPA